MVDAPTTCKLNQPNYLVIWLSVICLSALLCSKCESKQNELCQWRLQFIMNFRTLDFRKPLKLGNHFALEKKANYRRSRGVEFVVMQAASVDAGLTYV